jgi:hypothetical protein
MVAVSCGWKTWLLCLPVGRPGDDRLSRVLRRSTIGAEGFHGRVRNGIGCWAPRYDHQVVRPEGRRPAHGFAERVRARRARAGSRRVRRRMAACAVHASAIETDRKRKSAVRTLPRHDQEKDRDQANRAIRTGRLNALLRFHPRPINVVVFHGSQARPGLEGGFPLRCLQRLSRPHIATRRCRWRDNRYTRGASIPVLSY